MFDANSILLYVADVPASTAFYERLLDLKPVEASETFAMFILPSGLGLGLWARPGVIPPANTETGGSEVGFKVSADATVDAVHAEWRDKGARILFSPADVDFGRTFVAADPDGHRLRVYTVNDM